MDIFISKKMRNFILLAQTNNIARAAEKIHMTASPFGKSIAALEEQIGYTLFTRKDNNISLNKAGQELYQKLFPVYQRLSAIDNEIHNSGRRSREIVCSCPLISRQGLYLKLTLPADVDILAESDNPTHYADGFHCNARSPLQGYAMPFLHSVSA